ncbi:ABC transporter ATP-binding protein [Kaustia mangrovi]|uniref:ABC transporter ATP-binding protein n=1 Tax=Kaustia mangrovi TaxID=2593653 RepID=A0A7S8C295_9HYPH|nr:ABC transporter ATP-binding protein [Kaustia mangrovi]QPC42039.1 ABC transporter ATP-binding protein [Kaustia mangrovi]
MTECLTVDNLVTGYGKQEIVHGVSLTARRGEITCVFGPNGSGKSTVIKAVAGALPAWDGRIRLGEDDITGLAVHEVVRRGIVMMPQGGGVFPRLTVEENLRMGGYSLADGRAVERRVDALIGQFENLKRRRRVAAGSLSGGEQMMVAIARALVPEPSFILLDEPSAGLSPALVSETMERVKALRELGVGVVMVEQNIREALPVADRILILASGNEQFSGTPDEIRDDDQLMALYMGG